MEPATALSDPAQKMLSEAWVRYKTPVAAAPGVFRFCLTLGQSREECDASDAAIDELVASGWLIKGKTYSLTLGHSGQYRPLLREVIFTLRGRREAQRLFDTGRGAQEAPVPATSLKKKRKPAQGAVVRELLREYGVAEQHFSVTKDRRTGHYTVTFGHPAIGDLSHRGTNPARWWAKRICERFDCVIIETDEVIVSNPARHAIVSAAVVLADIPTPKAQPPAPVFLLPATVRRQMSDELRRHIANATARRRIAGGDVPTNVVPLSHTVSGDSFDAYKHAKKGKVVANAR